MTLLPLCAGKALCDNVCKDLTNDRVSATGCEEQLLTHESLHEAPPQSSRSGTQLSACCAASGHLCFLHLSAKNATPVALPLILTQTPRHVQDACGSCTNKCSVEQTCSAPTRTSLGSCKCPTGGWPSLCIANVARCFWHLDSSLCAQQLASVVLVCLVRLAAPPL